MKICIKDNIDKDQNSFWLNELVDFFKDEKISYYVFDSKIEENTDAVIVFGGDGTILSLTEFLDENTPVLGINAGKLGFLTEFEIEETKNAIKLFKENKLKKDIRETLSFTYNGKTYFALNDVVIERVYSVNSPNLVIDLSVNIGGNELENITGDGIILSTPTGSTAYSLSAGGAILSPNLSAISLTPISAHSLNSRPVIFSAETNCAVTLKSQNNAGIFVDGKYIGNLSCEQSISVSKSNKKVVFLRKNTYDFFKRLNQKLSK